MMARRFPPPWSVEDIGAAFVVTDSAGQKLAYVYFEAAKCVCCPLPLSTSPLPVYEQRQA